MDPANETELAELSRALAEVAEEVDFATDADAEPDEITSTQARATVFLRRYDQFLHGLDADSRAVVQRSIGLRVEHMKGRLTGLT